MIHRIRERGEGRVIEAWCRALRKQDEVAAVCDSIAQHSLIKRSFVLWSDNVKFSILKKSLRITSSAALKFKAATFRAWIGAYSLKTRQQLLYTTRRRRCLLAHLRAWRKWTKVVRCLESYQSLKRRQYLSTVLVNWRWKFNNRGKLRSVFSLAALAASMRWERSNLSEFQFLRMMFCGWRDCIFTKRKIRGCFLISRSLQRAMLRFKFRIWKTVSARHRVSEIREKAKLERLKQAYFLEWCIHTVECSRRASIALRKYSLYRMGTYFERIRTFNVVEKSRAVHHYNFFLMKSSFEAILQYRHWTKHDRVRNVIEKQLMRKALGSWEQLTMHLFRQRRGLEILEQFWLRQMVKLVLYRWPGRIEFRKAEQMRIRLSRQQKNMCCLVDVPSITLMNPEVPSFIQPRRLSLLEKAIAGGYIADRQDREGILRLFQLLQAVFDGWRIVLERKISIHRRARLVLSRHYRSICRIAWLNWMYLTPRVSHRVLIWTLPRVPVKILKSKSKEISSIMEMISQNSALSKSTIATLSVIEGGNANNEEVSRC